MWVLTHEKVQQKIGKNRSKLWLKHRITNCGKLACIVGVVDFQLGQHCNVVAISWRQWGDVNAYMCCFDKGMQNEIMSCQFLFCYWGGARSCIIRVVFISWKRRRAIIIVLSSSFEESSYLGVPRGGGPSSSHHCHCRIFDWQEEEVHHHSHCHRQCACPSYCSLHQVGIVLVVDWKVRDWCNRHCRWMFVMSLSAGGIAREEQHWFWYILKYRLAS
jgi:hypothetical protein